MKKNLSTLVLLLLAAGSLFLLYQHFFPNEEKRIRRRLAEAARVASVEERASVAAQLTAADRLRDCLTTDVEIEVDVPGGGRQTFGGRQEIIQGLLAARANLTGLKIEFLDITVALGADGQTATADLTARVEQGGDRNWAVQELRLKLKKEDGQWRIGRAETVKTLKL